MIMSRNLAYLARVLVAGTTLTTLVTPGRMQAQIRASELQSVSQTVDGTNIRLTYSRPRMRGRWPIFGTKAVQWGEVWTPGANWATLFETNRDISVGNVRVPRGKYGVWFVVRKDSAWTMLLDNNVIYRIPTTTISTSSKSEHFMFFSTLPSIVKYVVCVG